MSKFTNSEDPLLRRLLLCLTKRYHSNRKKDNIFFDFYFLEHSSCSYKLSEEKMNVATLKLKINFQLVTSFFPRKGSDHGMSIDFLSKNHISLFNQIEIVFSFVFFDFFWLFAMLQVGNIYKNSIQDYLYIYIFIGS